MQPSLWTNFFTGLSVADKLRQTAAAGFATAEIAFEDIIDPDTGLLSESHAEMIRDVAASVGLATPQVHYPITTLRKDAPLRPGARHAQTDLASEDAEQRAFDLKWAQRMLELCPICGIKVMVIHPGGAGGWEDDAGFDRMIQRNAEAFSRLAETAERVGATVAIENLGRIKGRRSMRSDFEELSAFIDQLGSKRLGVCLDTSHANYLGIDIPAGIHTCGHRLVATHMSDNLGEHDDHLMPYGGKIAWEPIVAALREIGYEGPFNLEIPGENRCPMPVRLLKARYARDLLRVMLEE